MGRENMKKPFIFIGCKKRHRDQFKIKEGVQPTCALLYLVEGSFLLNIEGKETSINAGDCAIFYDDTDFFRSVTSPITFIILQFQPNPGCPFSLPLPVGKVSFQNPERFRDSIMKYQELMDTEDPRSIYYKEHLLEDILLQAFAENSSSDLLSAPKNPENIRDTTVIHAAAYIRENLDRKLTIEEICHTVGTNASTLNFKFHKEFSSSVGSFVVTERMKKARFLLSNTTHSIKEVAARCGYDSIYYFSSAFRKVHGSSPSEYRNQHR